MNCMNCTASELFFTYAYIILIKAILKYLGCFANLPPANYGGRINFALYVYPLSLKPSQRLWGGGCSAFNGSFELVQCIHFNDLHPCSAFQECRHISIRYFYSSFKSWGIRCLNLKFHADLLSGHRAFTSYTDVYIHTKYINTLSFKCNVWW